MSEEERDEKYEEILAHLNVLFDDLLDIFPHMRFIVFGVDSSDVDSGKSDTFQSFYHFNLDDTNELDNVTDLMYDIFKEVYLPVKDKIDEYAREEEERERAIEKLLKDAQNPNNLN